MRPQIYAYTYRRISDPWLAEDLTSLVLVKALQAEREGKGARSSMSGWLHRIAHNLIIDHYRERERRLTLDLEEVAAPAHTVDYVAVVEAARQREWLQTALTRMTEKQAQMLALQIEGYCFEEIATLMGSNLGAVKALRHRGLVRLQELAQETHIDARR